MKSKVIYISVLSLSLAFMAACEQEQEIQPVDNGTIGLRLEAVSPFEGTSIAWQAVSDRVGVYVKESEGSEFLNENAYYSAYSSTSRSLFKPLRDDFNVSWESGKKYDVSAYYPYSTKITDPTAISVSISGKQVFDMQHPEEVLKDSSILVSQIDGISKEELVELKMHSVASFVKITLASVLPMNCAAIELVGEEGLSFEDGSYNLLTGTLSEGEKGNKVIVSFPYPVTIGSAPVSVIAKVNPLYKGQSITINPIVDGGDFEAITVDVPQGGFVSGQGVEYTSSYSFEAVDLSVSGTANAYVVNKPGTLYSFDATVKGNGNFTPVEWSCNGEPVRINFDTDIAPVRAELLWYSTPKTKDGYHGQSPVEKTSVAYVPSLGKILFKTPAKFVNGNAVIAAFDESGNIVWSWNIWAVEGYDPLASASKVGRFTMMDRNLGAVSGFEAGAVSDNIEAASALGNYYQWGRKDPFPAAPEYTGANHEMAESWGNPAYTDLSGYAVDGGKIFSSDRIANGKMLTAELGADYSLERAVAESVKYPHKWMFGGRSDACYPQYSWTSGEGDYDRQSPARKVQWEGLWGSVDNVSNVKTIYDPCPPGWKVPTADVYYTAFEDLKLASGGHGVLSADGLYFPFTGQRKAGYGGSVITQSGEIMMSTSSAASSMYPLRGTALISNGNIFSGRVTSSNSYAGAGYQVRCVREDVEASSQGYGKQSGHDAALMGDSITRTWRDRGRSAFFTENNYLNKGIDGTTTTNMINRFTSDILEDDPAVVMIMGGTNDLAWNDGYFECEEDIVANVKLMAYAARDIGAKVIIGSVCPSRSMWWKDEAWRNQYDGDYIAGQIKKVNAQLKSMAQEEGFAFVDFYSVLTDEQGGLAAKYCWDFGGGNLDSVHPNAAAFLVMEGVLKPVIDELLKDPSAITPGHGGLNDMDKWIW